MCIPMGGTQGGGGFDRGATDTNSWGSNQATYQWMAPGQDVLNQLGGDITKSLGFNFGQRNLFGSGIQQQTTMEELIRQALGKTQLVNTGNTMTGGQNLFNKQWES